jgi:Xaa-Pro aminopeptidase
MLSENLDGLLLSSQANISYLTGYRSRESYLLISKKETIYFTDGRYLEEAKIGLKNVAKVEKTNGAKFKVIADVCRNLKLERLGFEERYLTCGEHRKIREALDAKLKLIPTYGLVEKQRMLKNQEEITKIKRATEITVKTLKFIKGFIKEGIKEVEAAAELEKFLRYNGASASGFDIIVASGPNSAFPHHITSSRKIKEGEPVLIDIGVDYFGYKSDLTRVFFLGKINSLIKDIYNIVFQAQARAIKSIKPGVNISEIDLAARQYITQKGFGGFFNHGLGHGVGLEIHEEPRIHHKEKTNLEAGMVFTVEPAIYLTGKFGIRLEDMVLVTKGGVEVLSGSLNK